MDYLFIIIDNVMLMRCAACTERIKHLVRFIFQCKRERSREFFVQYIFFSILYNICIEAQKYIYSYFVEAIFKGFV